MPLNTLVVTARTRSLGQGNIFRSVCQEFCPQGEGVCLSACWDTTPLQDQVPPWDHAPIPHLDQVPPGTRHPSPTWTGHPPDQAPPSPDQAPPWTRHPPRTRHPPEQSMPGDTVNERAVRILLKCNLVWMYAMSISKCHNWVIFYPFDWIVHFYMIISKIDWAVVIRRTWDFSENAAYKTPQDFLSDSKLIYFIQQLFIM